MEPVAGESVSFVPNETVGLEQPHGRRETRKGREPAPPREPETHEKPAARGALRFARVPKTLRVTRQFAIGDRSI